MMIWQLLQVRHVQGTPLILVGKMWPGLVEWARSHLLTTQPPLANPEDIAIPRCVDTADQAIDLIRQQRTRWLQEKPTQA
jgi:predicted Rossmann-fold nucleotide-binding protein